MDAEENRLLTECGPGTPGGRVLRSYWQPAALAEELGPEVAGHRPVVPVTLLGEELVLFRDELDRIGLVSRWCPHRGVDLAFGRREGGGLRCPFHGWLFDVEGNCLETPAEPAGSTFHTRVRIGCYPAVERNGIIWAWLGGGEPPPLPGLDCFIAPTTHVFAFKGMWASNWLQAHEVGIDPAHAAFLHRFFPPPDEANELTYGLQFRAMVADTGIPVVKLMREVPAATITVEPTAYGFRLRAVRNYHGQFTHVRVSNCIFPNAIAIAMSPTMTIMQWHVPIDAVRCYWYSMFVSYADPVDAATLRAQRIGQVELPSYRPRTGAHDRWGFDAEEQATATYTGMGTDINVHDQWAVESPGPVYDRTKEHLSPTDVGIRTHRRLFLAALRDPSPATLIGAADPAALTGPAAIDAATAGSDFDDAWRRAEAARRRSAPWAASAIAD
ncbi:MAG: aromatic ring-hydroxylating dioxygenase subunit alpha [Acidimicrobiia bacterium]|nr:aromatic ring-hydroxylating dioxygenase subunit alpha [Acidimicrobiia bacterium]